MQLILQCGVRLDWKEELDKNGWCELSNIDVANAACKVLEKGIMSGKYLGSIKYKGDNAMAEASRWFLFDTEVKDWILYAKAVFKLYNKNDWQGRTDYIQRLYRIAGPLAQALVCLGAQINNTEKMHKKYGNGMVIWKTN